VAVRRARICRDSLFVWAAPAALAGAAGVVDSPVIIVGRGLGQFLEVAPAAPVATDPNGTFLVGFTSGSTSRPKAFARSRRSWQISLEAGRDVFDLYPTLHTLAPGPLSHGLTLYALAETLDIGAAFVTTRQFSASKTAMLLRDGLATRLVAVPSMVTALCDGTTYPETRQVTTAGAKLDPALLTRARVAFPNAVIIEYYGASELGFVSYSRHDRTTSDAPPQAVGHPFPHVDLPLRTDGHPVPPGPPGPGFRPP